MTAFCYTQTETPPTPGQRWSRRYSRRSARVHAWDLAGDDPEHVIVVPGGLFAPTAKAGLTAAIGGDEVAGDFAEQGEVAGSSAIAHPAVILMSRGFDPASHPAKPLVNYQSNRQLSGWNLPPLVKRAIGAHCESRADCVKTRWGGNGAEIGSRTCTPKPW